MFIIKSSKSPETFYIFEIFAARAGGRRRGGWSLEFGVFVWFFLKTLVFANIWKDFMVPKYCLAQDDTEYVNVPAIF